MRLFHQPETTKDGKAEKDEDHWKKTDTGADRTAA